MLEQKAYNVLEQQETITIERSIHQNRKMSAQLLKRVLSPYSPTETDYLKSMELTQSWEKESHIKDSPLITAIGKYKIPNSCYIQDTGHFNAVEFIICYNQIVYASLAYIFNEKIFNNPSLADVASSNAYNALSKITTENFFSDQLSSIFILKTETHFKSVINARDFSGEFSITDLKVRKNTLYMKTSCVFSDDNDGYSRGETVIVWPFNFNNPQKDNGHDSKLK